MIWDALKNILVFLMRRIEQRKLIMYLQSDIENVKRLTQTRNTGPR